MNVKPSDIVRALAYPLTESSVLVPLIFFWLMVSLASWGGFAGLFLMFLVLPALLRYQMILLEARARGVTPEVPGIEFFNWFGNGWTLFPVVLVIILTWATVAAGARFGIAGEILMLLLAGIFFPASIAVLAITHSPLQSLNPVALQRLWKKCAATFWLANVFLVVFCWLSIIAEALPMMLAVLLQMILTFSFFSLVGSLIRPYRLIEDIDIPPSQSQDASAVAEGLEKVRGDALTHAYGFISRGNRDGGFRHLFDCIDKDPDPVAAWAWFFERMLAWDSSIPAMFFAQHYVHDHLKHGEQVAAVKLIMRCRLIDAQFRPFPDDLEAAIVASEACDNAALATSLRQY
ncbi:MAG: hypothetical protein ACR2QZ_10090 [Woeseiaceae bacterium]